MGNINSFVEAFKVLKKDNIGIQFYHVKDGFDEMLQPLRMHSEGKESNSE